MPETKYRKKLIEVALPLEAINRESAREKSIRHGHPSTLHLWWARRPLATARAVLFAQLVDDPSAWPELFPTEEAQEAERKRLFQIIEDMVPWEASNNEELIGRARREIAQSWARSHPSKKATRVLAKNATAKEINDYLATELPPVHDPFAGGGTIPLEAQRLGLRAIASDLNPVAVLINKALIEIPPRFAGKPPVNPESRAGINTTSKKGKSKQASLAGTERTWKGAQGLAEDVRYYGRWMRDEAKKRIGHLYPDVEITAEMAKGRPDLKPFVGEKLTVIAWLWARTVSSPDPAFAGLYVPLVSSFWLSTKKDKQTWVEPVVNDKSYRFEIRTGKPKNSDSTASGTKLGRGANFRCVLSGTPIAPEYIKAEGLAKRMDARLMAIVAEGKRSRVYLAPTAEMERIALSAKPSWIPEQELPKNPRWFSPPDYGMPTYGDLFTPRQLVALTTFSDLVLEARAEALSDATLAFSTDDQTSLQAGGCGATAYADAIVTYLCCCHSAMLDDLSTIVTWRPSHGTGATRTTFARQALPMTWDYAEANPFASAGGDIGSSSDSIGKVLNNLTFECPVGIAYQRDAVSEPIDGPLLLSTDPPYFDNIGYADLSDFFYVWLRRHLSAVFPEITRTLVVPKASELVATPYRHGGRENAIKFFLDGMTATLRSLATRVCPGSLASIYYAFKQSETDEAGQSSTGWETFLSAVISSGLVIGGTWPMRTEKVGRSIEIGTNALASSIVLSCGAHGRDASPISRNDLRRSLRLELPMALAALQHGNIAPVDLAQASIGPGMAIFSRYAKVLESDGSLMTVRSALQLINEVLDEYFTEQEGELDADSRFAVTWYENHAFDPGPYGEAETLAKARAVAVEGIAEAGILKSSGGKVRLLKRSELREDWDPTKDSRLTVWEATQHLIKRLDEQGEAATAELLGKLGSLAGAARDLAYRLYSTCERKRWAEEARAYNGLVAAWSELERLASQSREAPSTPAQQRLL